MIKKCLCILFTVFLLFVSFCIPVNALSEISGNSPYLSYGYDLNGEVNQIAAPFVPNKQVTGISSGVGAFSQIGDICYDSDNHHLLIADTGNNRIVILNNEFEAITSIDNFSNNGQSDSFNKPSGLFIKGEFLYVSDTENGRVIRFNIHDFSVDRIFNRPEIKLLKKDYTFRPTRIVVDRADRMYIVCTGINDGFVYLDSNGKFLSFIGAPEVDFNVADMLWRKFMTEKQIAATKQYVPTEYNSIEIDEKGFLYSTTQTADVSPIVRLNSQGTNVLKSKNEKPAGDGNYTDSLGNDAKSALIDITVYDNGTYLALDNENGRIFAYSSDGEMLYAFGAKGTQQLGTFESANCIEIVDKGIIVSDYSNGTLTYFKKTKFGSLIDEALAFQQAGDYKESYNAWIKVLSISPKYMPSQMFLARIDIQNGNFKMAMNRLKILKETDYYSKAFRYFRSEFVKRYFYQLLFGVLSLIVIFIVGYKNIGRIKFYKLISKKKTFNELKYSKYVIFHPIDGFWDLKREKRGSFTAATVIFVEFILVYALRSQFTGYIISGKIYSEINVFLELVEILLPIFLWIISNWCFTTLMDGEGTVKDIFIATSYALRPYVIAGIPLLLLSSVLTEDEMFIYTVLDGIVIVWVLLLIFFGMITTHNYSLGKGVVAAILTVVGICLMLFLILVCLNLLQDLVNDAGALYQEIFYRFY